jgi:hypothetical protein
VQEFFAVGASFVAEALFAGRARGIRVSQAVGTRQTSLSSKAVWETLTLYVMTIEQTMQARM